MNDYHALTRVDREILDSRELTVNDIDDDDTVDSESELTRVDDIEDEDEVDVELDDMLDSFATQTEALTTTLIDHFLQNTLCDLRTVIESLREVLSEIVILFRFDDDFSRLLLILVLSALFLLFEELILLESRAL